MAPLPQIRLALPLQAFSKCAVTVKLYWFFHMPSFLCSTPGNCIWIRHRFIFKCILQNDKSKRASSWDVTWHWNKFSNHQLFYFSYKVLNAPSVEITFLWNFCHLFPVMFYCFMLPSHNWKPWWCMHCIYMKNSLSPQGFNLKFSS